MSLRPGKCYSKPSRRPNTRQSKRRPRKSYVKGVPGSKIHQFVMGNKTELKTFEKKYYLVSKSEVFIRSNALEAARISITKYLTKKLSDKNFVMQVLVYPHHIMRENCMATGAGADRFSQGMKMSFGKPIGVSARIKKDQNIFSVHVHEGNEAIVKEALKRASSKLPCSCRFKTA